MNQDNRKTIKFPGCQTREGRDDLVDIYIRDHALPPQRLYPSVSKSKKVAREVAALRAKANRILNPLIK